MPESRFDDRRRRRHTGRSASHRVPATPLRGRRETRASPRSPAKRAAGSVRAYDAWRTGPSQSASCRAREVTWGAGEFVFAETPKHVFHPAARAAADIKRPRRSSCRSSAEHRVPNRPVPWRDATSASPPERSRSTGRWVTTPTSASTHRLQCRTIIQRADAQGNIVES